MQKGLVTVVVPIYNTEKYLNRCIDSIVNQTYQKLEILLIDDGSPDNCPQMCDAWARKDNRIRVIHKKNEGLGFARNTGIENATGEYICFFDSDDYVALDTIEKAYMRATEETAEVVAFGFSYVDISGNIQSSFVPPMGKKTYRGKEVRSVVLPDLIAPDPNGNGERQLYMSACMMLFSMEPIQRVGWRFVSEREIISEDVYSLLDLFGSIDSVAVLPEALYYYFVNEVSLSRKYLPGRYQKIRYFYEECIALCEKLEYGEKVKHRVSKPYLAFTLAALKREAQAPKPEKERFELIKEIINDSVLQQVLLVNQKDRVSLTRKIMFWAMRNKYYVICFWLLKVKKTN